MHAIVEARHIHHLRKARTQRRLSLVHTLCNGSCRVVLVAECLQMFAYLSAFFAPLLRYLVADAPHHDRRMVAVVAYEVLYVAVSPLLEVQRVAVLAFRVYPHVETLRHHHHTHRVAHLHLPRRRHVVRRAYGIASHVLHRANLTDECRLVYGCAQRTQVVVQAYALYLARLAVQLEAVVLRHTHRAYAYLLAGLVYELVVAVKACDELI